MSGTESQGKKPEAERKKKISGETNAIVLLTGYHMPVKLPPTH